MYIKWNPIKVKRVAVKPCPNCGSTHISKGNIVTKRLPNWWYVVCEDCGYTTETKLFLRRAVKCWNEHSRDHIFSDSDIDFSNYWTDNGYVRRYVGPPRGVKKENKFYKSKGKHK